MIELPILNIGLIMNIEEILDDLGDSMASPEVRIFHMHMKESDYKKALKILKEHTDKETAQFVVEHFKKLQETDYDLVEIKASDVVESKKGYIFRVGTSIAQSPVFAEKKNLFFYSGSERLPMKKAQQIWDMVAR